MNKPYIVLRRASLMEDEGRDEYINKFETYDLAMGWIQGQRGKYFSPDNYYVAVKLP